MRYIHTKDDKTDNTSIVDEGKRFEYKSLLKKTNRTNISTELDKERQIALLSKAQEKRIDKDVSERHDAENKVKKDYSEKIRNTSESNKTSNSTTKFSSKKDYEYSPNPAPKTAEAVKGTVEKVNITHYVPKTSVLARKVILKSIKNVSKSVQNSFTSKSKRKAKQNEPAEKIATALGVLSAFFVGIMTPFVAIILIVTILASILFTLFGAQDYNSIIRKTRFAQYQELHSAMYDIETSYYADCVDYCNNNGIPIPSEVTPINWANVIALAWTLMSCQNDTSNDGPKQVAYFENQYAAGSNDLFYWSDSFYNQDEGNIYSTTFDTSSEDYLFSDGWCYVANFNNNWVYDDRINSTVCATSNEFDIAVPCLYNAFFVLYYSCPGFNVTNADGMSSDALSADNKLLVRGEPLIATIEDNIEYNELEDIYGLVMVYNPSDSRCPEDCSSRNNMSHWSPHSHRILLGTETVTHSAERTGVVSTPRTPREAIMCLYSVSLSRENNYWKRFFDPAKTEYNCLYKVVSDSLTPQSFYIQNVEYAAADYNNNGIPNIFETYMPDSDNYNVHKYIYDLTTMEEGTALVPKIREWAETVHQMASIQATWKETVLYIAANYAYNIYAQEMNNLPIMMPPGVSFQCTDYNTAPYRGNGTEFYYDWYNNLLGLPEPQGFACYGHGRSWNANWCNSFVSWLANYNGIIHQSIYNGTYSPAGDLISSGYFRYEETVAYTAAYYNDKHLLIPKSQMQELGYTPQTGDLIMITNDGLPHPSFQHADYRHIAIVIYFDGTYLYTLEGNTGTTYRNGNDLVGYVGVNKRYLATDRTAYFAAPFGYC